MKQEAIISHFRLKRDFSWILAGNLYYAGTQYLLLIAIARFASAETLGRFALALAITGPVNLFLSLSLRAVMISDSKNEYPISNYLWVRVLTSILSVLVVLAIVIVNHYPVELAYPIILIAVVKAIESSADLYYGIFQKKGKNHQIANSMAMRGTLSGILGILILLKTGSLTAMCGGLLISSLLVIVFYDSLCLRSAMTPGEWSPANKKIMQLLVKISLPLAFAIVLSSLELNIPRYLIEHKIGLAALGIFSALSYPLMLGNQIVGALASSASPRLAELFHENHYQDFKNLLMKLSWGGAIVGAATAGICAIFGKSILSLLKHQEYIQDSSAFSILALAAGISYVSVFFGAGLSAMKCFHSKFLLQVSSFFIVCVFAFLAANQKSVYAMSIAILLGSVFSLISQFMIFFFHFNQSSRLHQSDS